MQQSFRQKKNIKPKNTRVHDSGRKSTNNSNIVLNEIFEKNLITLFLNKVFFVESFH